MKRKLRNWLLRIIATVIFIMGLLIGIVLNPVLCYAKATTHQQLTIYHNQPLPAMLIAQLDTACALVKASEFYNPKLKLDICLNDGSAYPKVIRKIWGDAFAWGFYNKVVVQGNLNTIDGQTEYHGYRWNTPQLLAHEMVHCMQFDRLGLWRSKPVVNIPEWKWEGYAEYIARKSSVLDDLVVNINRYQDYERKGTHSWEILLPDNSIVPVSYYRYWLLLQYSLDIKKLTYQQVLDDSSTDAVLWEELLQWHNKKTYDQLHPHQFR